MTDTGVGTRGAAPERTTVEQIANALDPVLTGDASEATVGPFRACYNSFHHEVTIQWCAPMVYVPVARVGRDVLTKVLYIEEFGQPWKADRLGANLGANMSGLTGYSRWHDTLTQALMVFTAKHPEA